MNTPSFSGTERCRLEGVARPHDAGGTPIRTIPLT
jgi:hypothetical protein